MTDPTIPRSTYRLQLTREFTFQAACRIVPYLADLGISHVYLSPILRARNGSSHGYDTVDHRLISPELGGEAGFRQLAAELRANDMGIVLDIVPNHMGVGGAENELWLNLLEWGQGSVYADWFDVNWSPSEPTLEGKVLVPFLGTTYSAALEGDGLKLRYDAAAGEFAVWAEGVHKLPIAPSTYPVLLSGSSITDLPLLEQLAIPGEPSASLKSRLSLLPANALLQAVDAVNASPERLHQLIERQNWRPARYSVAADDINYRRFFIVSDLAAIRIEREDVFEHIHQIPLRLIGEGLVDGLRVDHIDGLKDPKAYCLRLRARCSRPIYLVVEKILAPHEQLRRDWEVDGTTGYEFATAVTQLLTDPTAEDGLSRLYEEQAGPQPNLAVIERETKLGIIDFEMPAELDALTTLLHKLARQNLASADVTRNSLRTSLRAYVAALPVYRTYVDADGLDEIDRRNIGVALAEARRAAPEVDPEVFDFLERVLLNELGRPDGAYDEADVREVAQRIQQYSGPVMAKGLEDTALYRFHRLVALSDVGEKPSRFTRSVASFHDFCRAQWQQHPNGLLTTSSHDTKRGEDARARILALTGGVEEWAHHVKKWSVLLAEAGAPEIDGNDRYYFYQLLLGAWPTEFGPKRNLEHAELSVFRERLLQAMLKSVREARQRTNWAVPQADYEDAIARFTEVAVERDGEFLQSFRAFERRIGPFGVHNGLVELTLKLTAPGVPDIYQGAEFWEQSLVDPDNRRTVDFAARQAALTSEMSQDRIAHLTENWRDGRVKQAMLRTLLQLRAAMPEVFEHGDYTPLAVDYPDDSVLAFARRHEGKQVIVCVRRYPWRSRPWEVAKVDTPADGGGWTPVLGDVRAGKGALLVSFDLLPVAIIVQDAGRIGR